MRIARRAARTAKKSARAQQFADRRGIVEALTRGAAFALCRLVGRVQTGKVDPIADARRIQRAFEATQGPGIAPGALDLHQRRPAGAGSLCRASRCRGQSRGRDGQADNPGGSRSPPDHKRRHGAARWLAAGHDRRASSPCSTTEKALATPILSPPRVRWLGHVRQMHRSRP